MRKAIEMGYDVHGGNGEDGGINVPDLSDFMYDIADDFTKYLEEKLP
jgi:hypothetical protein